MVALKYLHKIMKEDIEDNQYSGWNRGERS